MKRAAARPDSIRPVKVGRPFGRTGRYAFKVLCPESLVAKVVGNQGAVVHQVEEQTNAHLQFSPRGEYYPDTRLRLLIISATEPNFVFDGVAAILDQVIARVEEDGGEGRSAGDFIDSQGRLIFKVALSKIAAGAIIGPKGERVRSLRETSGAMIDIDREMVDQHQLATIAGTKEQILSVLEELNGSVQADADAPWFPQWAAQREVSRQASGGKGAGGPPQGARRSEDHKGVTIFVGRLPQSVTAEGLESHFSRFGQVVDSDVRIDPKTGRSKGFGFVTFAAPHIVDSCLSVPPEAHVLDGRWVDVKRYGEQDFPTDAGMQLPEEIAAFGRGPEPRHMDRRDNQFAPNGHAADARWAGGGGGGAPIGSIPWFTQIAQGVHPDYFGLDYCLTCSLPSTKCGALIGRRGEHITDVQQRTGATVAVSKKEQAEGPDAHRTITITGNLLPMYAAHMLLMRYYNDGEAQFQAAKEREANESAKIEALQRQIAELSKEVSRVQSGGKGGAARRGAPPGMGRR